MQTIVSMSVDIDIKKGEFGRGWEGIGASFEVRKEYGMLF